MILLSIITVSFNSLRFLKRTNSTIPVHNENIETILIDGVSTDGTKDFMNSEACRYQIKISESDSGIYDAMNKGIRLATGKYLIFMNCGDYFVPDFSFEKILLLFRKNKTFLYVGDMVLSNGVLLKYAGIRFDRLFFLDGGAVPHQSTFIPKKVFEKCGLYNADYKISADQDFFLRARVAGFGFRSLGNIVSVYDNTGISSQPDNKARIEMERKTYIETHIGPSTFYMRVLKSKRLFFQEMQRKFRRLFEVGQRTVSPRIFCYHRGFSEILHLAMLNCRRYYKKSEIVLCGTDKNSYLKSSITHTTVAESYNANLIANYIHLSSNDPSFELSCIDRWFALRDYMTFAQIETIIHIDSDVLMQARIDASYFDNPNAVYACSIHDFSANWGAVSPHVSVWSLPLLTQFCSWIINTYRDRKETVHAWYNEFQKLNIPGGMCDMTLLYFFIQENHVPFVNLLEFSVLNSYVDNGMIQSRNDDLGEFELTAGFKTLIRNPGAGRIYQGRRLDGTRVNFWALHFQGEAKKILYKFVNFYTPREWLMTKARNFFLYKKFYKILFPVLWS